MGTNTKPMHTPEQVEAIEVADANLNNADLPLYSDVVVINAELLVALNDQLGFLRVLAGTVPLSEKDTHRRISIQIEEVRAAIAKAQVSN